MVHLSYSRSAYGRGRYAAAWRPKHRSYGLAVPSQAPNKKVVSIDGKLYAGRRGGLTRLGEGEQPDIHLAAQIGGSIRKIHGRGGSMFRGGRVRGRGGSFRGWGGGRGRGFAANSGWGRGVTKNRSLGGSLRSVTGMTWRSNNMSLVNAVLKSNTVASKLSISPSTRLRAKNKSLINVQPKKRPRKASLNLDSRSMISCVFYNRFGHCKRLDSAESCPYIHDPSRINVCLKWLHGGCPKGSSCLLLHERDEGKMPVCNQYLKGTCARDDCPYLHVHKGDNVEVCRDFVYGGFCAMGRECPLLHTWDCQEFKKKGKCSMGAKCRLRHGRNRDISPGDDESELGDEDRDTETEALLDSEGFLALRRAGRAKDGDDDLIDDCDDDLELLAPPSSDEYAKDEELVQEASDAEDDGELNEERDEKWDEKRNDDDT